MSLAACGSALTLGLPMNITVTCDSNWETKVGHAIRKLTLHEYFERRTFGASITGICIVINARDSDLGFRQRVRYEKSEKVLYFDTMLDCVEMARASHQI